jgi:hypothetical protein
LPGIGSSSLEELKLFGYLLIDCSSHSNSCITSRLVSLANTWIEARSSSAVFRSEVETEGSNYLALFYSSSATTQVESNITVTGRMLQLNELIFPFEGIWSLNLNQLGFVTPLSFNSSIVSSIAVSVPNVSQFKIPIS